MRVPNRADIPDRTKSLDSETQAFSASDPPLSQQLIERLFHDTTAYWLNWLHRCTYKGRWRETVQRAALCLKLLTFAPTGAIVAAPTFSLPEDLDGAGRNWDYRYAWIRDASFTVYALLRLGFTEEADAYVDWLSSLLKNKNPDGSLQIMYTIHGEKEIPEHELPHLDGHKGQKPVRIGNGAADHLQLDIYGELLDAVYLAQKMSRPREYPTNLTTVRSSEVVCAELSTPSVAYDDWLLVRELVDHVVKVHESPDLSIWGEYQLSRFFSRLYHADASTRAEVRGEKQNFLYSKVPSSSSSIFIRPHPLSAHRGFTPSLRSCAGSPWTAVSASPTSGLCRARTATSGSKRATSSTTRSRRKVTTTNSSSSARATRTTTCSTRRS